MRKHYSTLTFSAIVIEPVEAILFQSGKAGARVTIEAGVDPWIDSNGGTPTEITIDGSPLEF